MHDILQRYGKKMALAIAEATNAGGDIRFAAAAKPGDWQLIFNLPYIADTSKYENGAETLSFMGCGFTFMPPVGLKASFSPELWRHIAADAAALPGAALPCTEPVDEDFFPIHAYLHLARRLSPAIDLDAPADEGDISMLFELLTRPGANIAKKLTRKYSRELCMVEKTSVFTAANIRLYGEYIAAGRKKS